MAEGISGKRQGCVAAGGASGTGAVFGGRRQSPFGRVAPARSRAPGLRNSLVDVSTGCALDRGELRGGLSPRTPLAHPTAVELECATTRVPRPGAQRRFD